MSAPEDKVSTNVLPVVGHALMLRPARTKLSIAGCLPSMQCILMCLNMMVLIVTEAQSATLSSVHPELLVVDRNAWQSRQSALDMFEVKRAVALSLLPITSQKPGLCADDVWRARVCLKADLGTAWGLCAILRHAHALCLGAEYKVAGICACSDMYL